MILSVQNASFAYSDEKNLFQSLSFSLTAGEITSVIGPNGCGKTTLLKCVMGFLKLDTGCVMIDGQGIDKIGERNLRRIISYVPQAKGAYSSLDVENMILLGRAGKIGAFRMPTDVDYASVREIADHLGITHLLAKKCNEISGGEMQMVLIARALVAEPQFLVLDEPESNLDFRNQMIVLDTMTRLKECGMGILFNSHYPEHALAKADKVLLFQKGKIVFGKADEVITEANIAKAFGVKSVVTSVFSEGKTYHTVVPTDIIF